MSDKIEDPPYGAIENGRVFLRRLSEYTAADVHAHPIYQSNEYLEVEMCFNKMAEWIDDANAALATARSDALEEAAKWHGEQAEVAEELGIKKIASFHRDAAFEIRSLKEAMTITTEEAEAFARQLDANDPGVSDPVAIEFFGDVATALRALAEQRDLGDKQIHGLAEERERWKERAEAAECRLSDAHRAQGEAEGKLAASDMAGIVRRWKERAESAEARRDFLSARVDTLLAAGAGAELAMAALRDRAERAEADQELSEERDQWKHRAECAERAETRALAQAQDWRVRAKRAEAEAERLRAGLTSKDVEWVVNDLAELGVKIGNQFFFCYKGSSLVYGELDPDPTKPPVHDEDDPSVGYSAGDRMRWRYVGKREFGECIHPINYNDPTKIGTVSLADGNDWHKMPPARAALEGGDDADQQT